MKTLPYISRLDEQALAEDEVLLVQVLKACRPMVDHYMYLSASARKDGMVGFLYVNWHWCHAPRLGFDHLYHADAVSQLLRNMPERAVSDAKRAWTYDMRPFALPAYVDYMVDGHMKRVLLHHRKVGF